MVEGHSVHRVAAYHRKKLLNKRFKAFSPNQRFSDGAAAINDIPLVRIEAHGKQLFYFFSSNDGTPGEESNPSPVVVVNIHFGMAGAFALFDLKDAPAPKTTIRLRLENAEEGICAHLSAMTVQHGGTELYVQRCSKLGEDPLREDADPEKLWLKVSKSRQSIGKLLMDQSCFPGVGNIYRCEILLKAGVHPEVEGSSLTKDQFDKVWFQAVSLLRRGFTTGSILTVDPEEAKALGDSRLRRYIYNRKSCARCQSRVLSWDIAGRTCYACSGCQGTKRNSEDGAPLATPVKPFKSHCAPEPRSADMPSPSEMTVKELRAALLKFKHLSKKELANDRKAALVARLTQLIAEEHVGRVITPNPKSKRRRLDMACHTTVMRSPSAASQEKLRAGEGRNVEHVADMDLTLASQQENDMVEVTANCNFEPLDRGALIDWSDLDGDHNEHKSEAKTAESKI